MDGGDSVNLCEVCTATLRGETFIDHEEVRHYDRVHHKSYEELVKSKNTGCWICGLLYAKLGDHPTSQDLKTFCAVDAYDRVNARFAVFSPSSARVEADLHVSFATKTNPDQDRPEAPLGDCSRPQVACKLGSSQDLETIGKWIASCKAEHEHCQPQREATSGFLPTRVIDVQDAELGTVQLRDRDDPEVHQEESSYPVYWTLSHRWGDPRKILQLRKTTEARFRAGIPLSELSPTFRDAVLLVHQLGYRYLWIDSLCVFQDLLSDWQTEANAMVDVYRHSFCNISATGASHSPTSTGLFVTPQLPPPLLHPFTANTDIVKRAARTQLDTLPGPFLLRNESAWTHDVERAPLSARGWVVQERFLAARILHFTRNAIYWECLEHRAAVTEPALNLSAPGRGGTTNATGYKIARLELARTKARLDSNSSSTGQGQGQRQTEAHADPNAESRDAYSYHAHWGTLVGLYVSCALTKESDRFLAMAGIAKAFRAVSGDEYLAGLWRGMLFTDLLWESRAGQGVVATRRGGGGEGREAEGYAPSWSWASVVGGEVQLGVGRSKFGRLPTPLIRLVSARVVPEPPEGGDAMGLLREAELEVECMLFYYRWYGGGRKEVVVFRDEARTDCYLKVTEGLSSALRLDTTELVERFAKAEKIEGVCLPVSGVYSGYGAGRNEYLMLECESGSRYRRIGLLGAGGTGKWINGWSEKRSTIVLV